MHFGGKRKFESVIESIGDRNPITLRALIPPKQVGALIGFHGQVHQQLQDLYNVHIYVFGWSDKRGRLTHVFGSPEAVAKMWRDGLFRMYGSRESALYGQNFQISFLVPTPLVEWLEETNVLERIHTITNGKTNVTGPELALENTTEHELTISINSMDPELMNMFEKAVYILALQFRERPDLAMSPYNVYYLPSVQEHHYRQQPQQQQQQQRQQEQQDEERCDVKDKEQDSDVNSSKSDMMMTVMSPIATSSTSTSTGAPPPTLGGTEAGDNSQDDQQQRHPDSDDTTSNIGDCKDENDSDDKNNNSNSSSDIALPLESRG
ncbi:hypothetical protein BDB00DRAFT_936276 [Zychaea mexicana]|uniref:uncharacterized protein n=1 Tax=Zychaea mexicana TaxID=64656 RepID=UPI0022FE6C42|nr:uncharacterized protein BDB00DRAFT_936276 [Zychaea mexicana]KAI9497456.1 hypothetical protein BDB00DRAFT_936276 [Zychaea mexicana]